MKKYLLSASVVTLVVTAGCTTLTAPEETKALKYATSVFTTALRDVETASSEADLAGDWEEYRTNVAHGSRVEIERNCEAPARQWRDSLTRAVATRGDWRNYDAVYARRLTLQACDVGEHDILPEDGPQLQPSLVDPQHRMTTGAVGLSEAAGHLNDYVEALADIATGESSAAADAARGKLVTAAQGFTNAIDSDNAIAGPLIGFAAQVFESIRAARRNAWMRNFLNTVDSAMPDLMERLGLYARVQAATALLNRARAAQWVARDGFRALNSARPVRNAGARVNLERLRTFDEIAARLETHNAAFRQLRASDPMIAARAFAKAHRALRDVFNDPDANRRAFLEAFHDFQTSASALAEALDKAAAD